MADSIREAAQRLLSEFEALASCSLGVAGLHQNGDVATWRELLEGGEYSHWLGDSLADLRIALAAETPAPAEPDTDAVLSLAAIIRRVDGSNSLGAAALAEAILSHLDATCLLQPPPPAPASKAEGEKEELAQWLESTGVMVYLSLGCGRGLRDSYFRAAALLRQPAPAPVPVPVAARPWEQPGWCDAEGRCWWGRCADDDEVFNPEWILASHADIEEFCSDAMPSLALPHWAIPQPLQDGEVQ